MSQILLTVAIATAVLLVTSIGALLAWGLTGGDGDSDSPVLTALGLLVLLGAVYNVVTTAAAFDVIDPVRWWLMWAAPAAALAGMALSVRRESPGRADDLGVGLALCSSLGLPALLVLVAGGTAL